MIWYMYALWNVYSSRIICAAFPSHNSVSSVSQLCLTLCDPIDCSMPGLSCPSPAPRACSNSYPSSQWCHPTISSSVVPFFSCLQFFPTPGSFLMSQLSLLFNMLSRLVITFLPRSKHLLTSWLQSPSATILEPPKIKSDTVSTVSLSISYEVMGPDAMILVFWMLF